MSAPNDAGDAGARAQSWRLSATPLLVELAEHARAALTEGLGLPAADAEYAGYLVMRRIVETMGGASVYLPKIDSVARHERDEAIWRAFDGRNHDDLARAHGVTTIHIYRLIKRLRAQAAARAQVSLFPDDADAALPPRLELAERSGSDSN